MVIVQIFTAFNNFKSFLVTNNNGLIKKIVFVNYFFTIQFLDYFLIQYKFKNKLVKIKMVEPLTFCFSFIIVQFLI